MSSIWASLLSVPVLFAGVVGLNVSLELTGSSGAYVGFLAALAIWGWIEQAFLSGLVTGPNRADCPANAEGWTRFTHAVGTIAYHEGLLLLALGTIWFVSTDSGNQITFWTFAVLFFARVSAKLNLFFGVPHINTEFIPKPLAHLPSYFRIRKINWVFPFSVSGLTFAVACWLERLYATGDVAFAFLELWGLAALITIVMAIFALPSV